jgi:hypothetical protein
MVIKYERNGLRFEPVTTLPLRGEQVAAFIKEDFIG